MSPEPLVAASDEYITPISGQIDRRMTEGLRAINRNKPRRSILGNGPVDHS
jgi:hypothetical protein